MSLAAFAKCFFPDAATNWEVCMISALLAAMNWEVCMIFCTFSGAVHDFYPYRGLKIMHTTDFVAELS